MDAESVVVDRGAEGESDNFVVYANGSSNKSQFVVMVQGVEDGAAFVVQILLVIIFPVGFVPFAFELEALGNQFGCDRDIFVIKFLIEVVDMIAFRLVFLSFQACQVFTQIDVIEIISFGNVEKSSGDCFFEFFFGIGRYA